MNETLISKWLFQTEMRQRPDDVVKRMAGVEESVRAVSSRALQTWISILFGLRATKAQLDNFKQKFRNQDPFFIETAGEFEIRVLAASCLATLLKTKPTAPMATMASIILAANFSISDCEDVAPGFRDITLEYIRYNSVAVRKLELVKCNVDESLEDSIRSLKKTSSSLSSNSTTLRKETYISGIETFMETIRDLKYPFNAAVHNQLILQEEINILWWFQKHIGFPTTKTNCSIERLTEIIQDLTELQEIWPPISSSLGLLNQVCKQTFNSFETDICAFSIIAAAERTWRETLAARVNLQNGLAVFCPIITSISKSLEVDEGVDCTPILLHVYPQGIKVKSYEDLMTYMFWEMTLLRLTSKPHAEDGND